MRDHSLNRAIGSLLVYLFYLGALTLSPFDFSSASIAERTWVFGNILLKDFLINIFGFVPFGAILYTLTRAGSGNVVLKFGITVVLAAILSLSIEHRRRTRAAVGRPRRRTRHPPRTALRRVGDAHRAPRGKGVPLLAAGGAAGRGAVGLG